MLMMLSIVAVGSAALILPLLCGVLILPLPDDPRVPSSIPGRIEMTGHLQAHSAFRVRVG